MRSSTAGFHLDTIPLDGSELLLISDYKLNYLRSTKVGQIVVDIRQHVARVDQSKDSLFLQGQSLLTT